VAGAHRYPPRLIDSAAVTPSPRAGAGLLLAGAGVALMAGAPSASASTPPPTTTTLTAASEGSFTDAAATLSIAFTATPTVVPDPGGTATSYVNGADEDAETLIVVPLTAYGAAVGTPAVERVQLFLDASGDDIELLANTQTRLGPYPAAYFVSRITLVDGRPAVLYGAVVERADDVHYVVFTDVGGDDGDAGRAFVESYAVTIDPYPAATTTTAVTASSATTASSTTATATASSTTAPATTTTTIPAGVTAPPDERWWIRFPEGANVSLRASSDDGLAYSEYKAVVDDDTLSVRVTEVPAALEWFPTDAAATEATLTGDTVTSSEVMTVGGAPAARFRLEAAEGGATEVLLLRSGGQLYRVAYVDGGDQSTDAANEFVDSFQVR
jgi:hypothetical protein